MVHLDRPDRRQLLVGLRGEVVPDVVPHRVRRERAAGVRLEQRHAARAARSRGSCPSRKSSARTIFVISLLELVGLGPGPVLVPAVEVARPRAAAGSSSAGAGRGILLEWQRAQRSAKTTLPRVEPGLVLGEERLAAGSVLPAGGRRCSSGRRAPCRASSPRSPASRSSSSRATAISIGVVRLAADQRVEVPQPLLAEEADVEVDAVERAERSDRVGAVLEHARRQDRVRLLEELGERARLHVVVELLVVELAAAERLPCPSAWRSPAARAGRRPRSSCAGC